MSYYKCECGSELFFQFIPQVFGQNDVRVFNAGKEIVPEHKSITLLKCVDCDRITIPSTSLVGKNALDLDVQVYKKLIPLVESHNNAKFVDVNNAEVMQKYINRSFELVKQYEALESEFIKLRSDLNALRDAFADVDPQVINPRLDGIVGEVNVKTSGRRKKNS